MVNDFIAQDDLPLFTSGSRFSLASVFLREGMQDMRATFDLFVREMPPSRNYFMFAGLEHVIAYLQNLRFKKDQLAWLEEHFRFSKKEIDYFRNFHFSGDLWAMPEGTLFFPNEPIVRITAPIIEAQIVEMFLINTVYLQTALASKLARFILAANGKEPALGFNRSYGMDAAMKATRWSKIFGAKTSLAVYDYKSGGSPPFSVGTFHYLMMAFGSELESFRKYLQHTQGKGYVLIDTYDSIGGLTNYIKAAKEIEAQGMQVAGIQLDSGDLYSLSCTARKMLNDAGLPHAKIFAMSNLDEWKVADLERRGAPIDVYGGLTQLLTPVDAPTMELVYKLSEVQHQGFVQPKMKTATQKVSLPGRKQVFRHEKAGRYIGDTLCLEEEKLDGAPLLQPIMRQGELVTSLPTLSQIHDHFFTEKTKFDPAMFSVDKSYNYPVAISDKLQQLAKETRKNITKAHHYDIEG
jgi:nicotinate phosphoribosyltransferase